MYEDQIKQKGYSTTLLDMDSLSKEEQECHFNITDESGKREILVDCSHQAYIRDILESELFTLKRVTLSPTHLSETGSKFILSIEGTMTEKGITIKKKKKIINEDTLKHMEMMRNSRKE